MAGIKVTNVLIILIDLNVVLAVLVGYRFIYGNSGPFRLIQIIFLAAYLSALVVLGSGIGYRLKRSIRGALLGALGGALFAFLTIILTILLLPLPSAYS